MFGKRKQKVLPIDIEELNRIESSLIFDLSFGRELFIVKNQD
jgi:hypothetical protein